MGPGEGIVDTWRIWHQWAWRGTTTGSLVLFISRRVWSTDKTSWACGQGTLGPLDFVSYLGSKAHSVSAGESCGVANSKYSPGKIMDCWFGARSRKAWDHLTRVRLSLSEDVPYVTTSRPLRMICFLAGLIATSFWVMNGVPAKMSTSSSLTTSASNAKSNLPWDTMICVSPVTDRGVMPSAC